MFKVKICGIRTMEDYFAALGAGADAIGLNFYEQSKRCIDPQSAKEVAANSKGKLLRVGLYVNFPADGLYELALGLQLDAIQAHGNENAAWFRDARKLGLPLIRAIRCPASAQALRAEIDQVPPNLYDVLLIDGTASGSNTSPYPAGLSSVGEFAPAPAIYGGSGAIANWQAIREIRSSIQHPLILAGGLTPSNVRQAIEMVEPDGVDVAGGVEGTSGEKDANKARQFTEAAMIALKTTSK